MSTARTGLRAVSEEHSEIRDTTIRGPRVELHQIGSALATHPGIDFATAISGVWQEGEYRLVAYVLPKEDAAAPTVRELQKHLLHSLPEQMIPGVFVRLCALPLSPNGKLDLALLPQPTAANMLPGRPAKAPLTPMEEKLLTMLRSLLKNDGLAAEDNFFLAGGDHLLGMQVVTSIQNAFGIEFTLQELLEAPTVERLALAIQTEQRGQRLARIWAELLGRNHCGLDENVFELGGHLSLVFALQERIAGEFGQLIPISRLIQNSTVRRQAELTLEVSVVEPVLPPGVLSYQPNGTRPSLFWVHYLNINLAKEFSDDQPIFLVTLTANDLASLGERPALRSIASCMVGKILATQSKGPFNIGGLCIGSVLAYEIACQLRAAGHEVSLLVLLDAPSPPYLKSYNSPSGRLRRLRYLLGRNVRLGFRQTLLNLRKRFARYLATSEKARFAWTELSKAQELIETAAFAYRPESYHGEVLLLIPSEATPHMNFLPGWQAVIPHGLHTTYVDGHHRELMTVQNARSIADEIGSRLISMC